jgi:hypothetical protein
LKRIFTSGADLLYTSAIISIDSLMDAAAKTVSSVSAFAGRGAGKRERINKSGKRIENLKAFETIILMAPCCN